MSSLLYIITFRSANFYRARNLSLTLQWLVKVKSLCDHMTIDIIVVEQDSVSKLRTLPQDVKHLFIYNKGTFNKGWAFNAAIRKYPDYHYYAFADGDLIIPDIQALIKELVYQCQTASKPAFRAFNKVLDTSMKDTHNVNNVDHIIDKYHSGQLTLEERQGLTFGGGLLVLSRQMYDIVGGWDENFTGWGREDDFMKIKLVSIGKCTQIFSNLCALHIWHPITSDFSLKIETIDLYNKYSQYNDLELYNHIINSRLDLGNPHKYAFDWLYYIGLYEDLRNAGIDTEEKAWSHYSIYGRKEGRSCCGASPPSPP